MVTDPPFNVPIRGYIGGIGRIRHEEFAQAAGEMSEAEFIAVHDIMQSHLGAASANMLIEELEQAGIRTQVQHQRRRTSRGTLP